MSNPDCVRRKGYSKIRLLAWALAIDKFGFVRCQTANCKFMAFDYDEMQQHYSNCFEAMDESKLRMCSICNLGTTNENFLNNHIIRYHPKEADKNGMDEYMITFSPVLKRVSKITKDGWTVMLEQKGYIKCLTPYCNFLVDSVGEMETHYGHCYEWYKDNKSCFSCVDCEGKTSTMEKMMKHISDCHPPGTSKDSPINNIPLALVDQWTISLNRGENIFCKTFNCKFMSDNVDELKRHYRFCRKPEKDSYSICPVCSNWCEPSKLQDHLKQHNCNEEKPKHLPAEAIDDTNKNSLTIIFDPHIMEKKFQDNKKKKKKDTFEPSVLENEEFPINFTHKVIKQYKPSTKKAQLKVQVPQVPMVPLVHSANIDLAKKDISSEVDLFRYPSPNEMTEFEDIKPKITSAPKRIPKRKSPSTRNLPSPKKKKNESILDSLGSKIMEEQSVSSDSLVPIEITVANVQWTLNVPPADVAQKVVEREKLSLKKILDASLKESRRIFYWNNSYVKKEPSNVQEHNPLKRKILDLKKKKSREVPRKPQIEPSVINLDNPHDISNILKKYATVISNEERTSNEEDKIFNNLVSDVETALDEDQFDISYLTNGDVDF